MTRTPSGFPRPAPPLTPGDRGGSQNLVIGRWHRFTQTAFGGFVAGEDNLISNEGASVSGGRENTAGGFYSVILGGRGVIIDILQTGSIAPQPPFP
jgi:hypothetical protein